MLAYGAASLIIALFFSALGFPDSRIGLFMTLTLAGDVCLSLLLTLLADSLGRRRTLVGGAALMVICGAVFAVAENFWLLLASAVLGVVSATGSDTGPFRAIEESVLAHLTTPRTRADVLSWYVVFASLGSATGTEVSGWVVESLKGRDGWELADAYHAVFWLYVAMGVLSGILTLLMSDKVEIMEMSSRGSDESHEGLLRDSRQQQNTGGLDGATEEEDHAEGNSTGLSSPHSSGSPQQKKGRFAAISSATRSVMYKLWFLLTVDCLADGMTSLSLTSYYLDRKFHLSKSALGTITSASYFLASGSTVFAGPLSRHLGLVKTMVFTHLPSSAAVLLFPAPRGVTMTVILFFVRMGLNNMDQAPRAALIAAVVKPDERTAVMGITNMLRMSASTVGPSITGVLAGDQRFWIAFVGAGALRILYDLGLWAMFVNMKLHAHETSGGGADPKRGNDEEEMRELDPSPSE